jgi:hypothetical protein
VEELDFALLRLSEPVGDHPLNAGVPGQRRGWVACVGDALTPQPRMVSILQHPKARPMKLSMGMVESLDLNANGTRLRHGIPTEPGSSGAPLFDKSWNVIGLHHSGEPQTIKPEYNQAIPIGLIVKRPKVAAAMASAPRVDSTSSRETEERDHHAPKGNV